MADENTLSSNEDPANTDPSAGADEQPVPALSPLEIGADEPTILHNAQASADESTQLIAPATSAASEQTILMAPATEQGEAASQAHEQAGAAFPVEMAAPGAESASGPLFAEQSNPQANAYEPTYVPAGYPATVAYGQPGYPQDMYQQPSMPLQPGQTAFAPAQKKRRTGLWVALIIVIVLLLGSGTAFAFVASQQPTNTPTLALQQFCNGYKALDAQKVYDTLSSTSKSHTTLAQLQQSFNAVKGLSFVKFSACTVSNVQQKDTTASGTITITITVSLGSISSSSAVPIPMQLVLENHTWKVDSTTMETPATMPTFPPDFLTPTVQGSNQ